MRFILASESARRVELLRRAGYDFEARRSGFAEVSYDDDPAATVEENARGKALAVAEAEPESLVLASDTVVYTPEGGVLGQAADADGVRRMLSELSGREHEVHTAVAVSAPGAESGMPEVRREVTRVKMRGISGEEIEAYVADGEGVGKAGGYAIQGLAAIFVERIDGDYTNVVGLPLSLAATMLASHGVRWY